MAYNKKFIEDVVFEERDPAAYYTEGCEFLDDFITKPQVPKPSDRQPETA
jgi:hypothetical protein